MANRSHTEVLDQRKFSGANLLYARDSGERIFLASATPSPTTGDIQLGTAVKTGRRRLPRLAVIIQDKQTLFFTRLDRCYIRIKEHIYTSKPLKYTLYLKLVVFTRLFTNTLFLGGLFEGKKSSHKMVRYLERTMSLVKCHAFN